MQDLGFKILGRTSLLVQEPRQANRMLRIPGRRERDDIGIGNSGRARLYEHEPRQLNRRVRELRQANMEARDPRQKGKRRDLGSGTQAEGRTSRLAQRDTWLRLQLPASPDKTPDTGSDKKQKKMFNAEAQRSPRKDLLFVGRRRQVIGSPL